MIPISDNGAYNPKWLKELEQLPELEILENNLRELIETDKSNLSLNEIGDLFFKKVIFFSNQSEVVKLTVFNELRIWRARKNVGKHEDLTTPKSFSYPPMCSENGRCNLKAHPVFYGSINMATAIFEVKPNIGEELFISDWQSSCERDIHARFLLPENVSESSPLSALTQSRLETISNFSNLHGHNKVPHLELISRFIGNYFVQEDHPYSLTSWLGNKILFDSDDLDLFFYASAKNKTGTLNLAIRTNFVDRYLRNSRVYQIRIVSIVGTAINFDILSVAQNVDNILMWRTPEQSDIQYLQTGLA